MANVGNQSQDCEDQLKSPSKVMKRKRSHHKKKESKMAVNGSKATDAAKSENGPARKKLKQTTKKKKLVKKVKVVPRDAPAKSSSEPENNHKKWEKSLLSEEAGTSAVSGKKKRKLKNLRKVHQDNEHARNAATETSVKGLGSPASPVKSTPVLDQFPVERSNTPMMATDSIHQGEFTAQLLTSVLPTLNPTSFPPDRLQMDNPSEIFKCEECGDVFLLEKSLAWHLQRRSVHVTLNCNCCRKTVTFYNRCSFLGHVRMHREKSQRCDANNAQVSPLPRDMFICGPPPLTSNDHQLNNHFPMSEMEEHPSHKSHGSQINPQCSECGHVLANEAALEDHFTSSTGAECSQDILNMPQCSKCAVSCPSPCFLSAHERLHAKLKPFVCPECGQKLNQSWEIFHQHLTFECLHYSRRLGYRCPACPSLFANKDVQFRHCVSAHGESYFKCQSCPMAFKSETAFSLHRQVSHDSEAEAVTIDKCPLCDSVFQSGEELRSHFEGHAQTSSSKHSKFVFLCPKCTLLCETKALLHNHLRTVHPSKLNRFSCPICSTSFETLEQVIYHRNTDHSSELPEETLAPLDAVQPTQPKKTPTKKSKKKSGKPKADQDDVTCSQCNQKFSTVQSYEGHKQHCRDKSTKCLVCGTFVTGRDEMRAHSVQHLDEGTLVCTMCISPVYNTRLGLANHLNSHATSMQYPNNCERCGEGLADSKLALRHFKMEHGLGNHVCQYCNATYSRRRTLLNHQRTVHAIDTSRIKFLCWMCPDRKFQSSNLLVKHLVNKHKIPDEEIDMEKVGAVSYDGPVRAENVLRSSSPNLRVKTEQSDDPGKVEQVKIQLE